MYGVNGVYGMTDITGMNGVYGMVFMECMICVLYE